MGEFVTVGRAPEVPEGEMQVFEVSGRRIAVANVGGAFYAFGDVCTHAQCSLAEGDLEGIVVTCPCHGSQFDVRTGAVVGPPAEDPVGSYPLRVEGEELQIEV